MAERGAVIGCMQLGGVWRRGMCGHEGHGELGQQLWKTTSTTKVSW
jgi:hypothetical protein